MVWKLEAAVVSLPVALTGRVCVCIVSRILKKQIVGGVFPSWKMEQGDCLNVLEMQCMR